jgi:mannose-6-phosphate isomerase
VLYPFTFQPRFKERVWGGRGIERLYGKKLPPGVPIGESWEISDRPGDASVIANGPLAGKDLRWLMENHARELLGNAKPATGNRFPLLCKILDAQEKLSLQVHPPWLTGGAGFQPASSETRRQDSGAPGGEPKTEMWYIADAAPGAELYVGLKRGVTRAEFEKKIRDGSVAECFHRLPVKAGDAMFLPSGRVHAIGAGLVIFEIQQNSDTTYRVFDWNRVGLDGKPRELHIAQSLASIDFEDFEPALVQSRFAGGDVKSRLLVTDPLFNVETLEMKTGAGLNLKPHKLQIIAVVRGQLEIEGDSTIVNLCAGEFCLVPAGLEQTKVSATSDAAWLRVEAK